MYAAKSYTEINETAAALAQACHERGDRITTDEDRACAHYSMFGSTGYPVRKLGRKWIVDHAILQSPTFTTKREAVDAWEIRIHIVIRMKGLQQYDEIMAGR